MKSNKRELGQFFTISNEWMQPQVVSFISKSGMKNVLELSTSSKKIEDKLNYGNLKVMMGKG